MRRRVRAEFWIWGCSLGWLFCGGENSFLLSGKRSVAYVLLREFMEGGCGVSDLLVLDR